MCVYVLSQTRVQVDFREKNFGVVIIVTQWRIGRHIRSYHSFTIVGGLGGCAPETTRKYQTPA
jgi:hypothetical protein